MADRLRACKGLSYPDAASLPIIRAAGGVSQLTDEQRAQIVVREVEAGDWCDDVPEESRGWLLERGDIEVVAVPDPPAPPAAPPAPAPVAKSTATRKE